MKKSKSKNSNKKTIKKILLYVFAGIMAVIVCVILYVCWVSYQYHHKVWEKPANVPAAALWKGGCDGGNWVELVDIKGDTLRFRSYYDVSGNLILDADYICQNCTNLHLTKENWSEYISDFNDDNLSIYSELQEKFKSDSGYCTLVPIYPAYYDLEKIIKSIPLDSTETISE